MNGSFNLKKYTDCHSTAIPIIYFFIKTKYSSLHNYKDYNKLHHKCPLQKPFSDSHVVGVGTIKLFTSFNFICFNSKKFVDFRGLLFSFF